VSDLIENYGIGWHVQHGDIDGAVAAIRTMLSMSKEELQAMGERGSRAVEQHLSKSKLCSEFVDVVERGLLPASASGKTGGNAS
jgi:glycosyltransferase involved in cell wall biosynthesis